MALQEVTISFSIEADSHIKAVQRLSHFVADPRNANLLPPDSQTYYYSNLDIEIASNYLEELQTTSQIPKTDPIIRTYCSVPYCNDKLSIASSELCEHHYCRQEESEQKIWSIWKGNYGWLNSKKCDGVEPYSLSTKVEADFKLLKFYNRSFCSVRKYLQPIESQKVWHIWKDGYGWAYSKNCDGKEPSILKTKAEAELTLAHNHNEFNHYVRQYQR